MPRSRRREMAPTNEALIEQGGGTATLEEPKPKREGPKSKREAAAELDILQRPPNEVAKDMAGDEPEPGEQAEMFPDLDNTKPEQKELLKRARKYAREKTALDSLLKENKSQVDGFMQKVIEQAHICEINKFKFGGIEFEIITGTEKVKIKIDTDDGEEADGDE